MPLSGQFQDMPEPGLNCLRIVLGWDTKAQYWPGERGSVKVGAGLWPESLLPPPPPKRKSQPCLASGWVIKLSGQEKKKLEKVSSRCFFLGEETQIGLFVVFLLCSLHLMAEKAEFAVGFRDKSSVSSRICLLPHADLPSQSLNSCSGQGF